MTIYPALQQNTYVAYASFKNMKQSSSIDNQQNQLT